MHSQERDSLWLGSTVALTGIAVLWGWALDWPVLRSVLPAFPEMKVNTAACFALGGFALCASADGGGTPTRGWRRPMASLCAALVVLVGGLTLGQHLAGWDFGIDDVLIRDTSSAASNLDADRMGPVTALCFMVIGGALLLLPRKSHFFSCVVQSLAAVVGLVALLPALGYAFSATELRLFLGSDSIALHTVGAFVALVFGVFIVTARRGWIQVITSSTFGSIAGRYLLPAVFVAPVALCHFHYQGRNLGWFSAELGFIISLVLNTALFFALTLWAISALNRVDRARENNEEALQELAENLQARVEQRTAEIAEINRQLRAEIDVRTAAEAALRKNEESYRTIAQSLPQLVWTCTADGRCDWLGPQWVAYAGVPETQLLSDRWTQQLHLDDRERATAAWEAASHSGLNFDIDFRVRRADGVYRWFKARAVPLHDATGAIVKWFGTSTDVHDLRQAETTVRENESRFSLMVEASLNGIVMVDPSGIIRHANPRTSELLGYAPGELDGRSVELLIPQSARAAHAQMREGYSRAPTPRGMAGGRELMAQRKDGTKIPVEIILQPLETLEGPQVMATIFDVSERLRVREALENINRDLEHRVAARTVELAEANTRAQEANRLKSEFLANMSHELRTPLNAIIGFADVLDIEKPGPLNGDQKDCVNEVLKAGRHLLRLINDLLDLAKIEAGRLEPSVQSFSFSTLVDEVIASLVPLATGKQISLTGAVNMEDDEVTLDPKMTKQILYNLLSNALKFTPEGGAVGLRVRSEPGGFIAVSVSDTGIGIEPDEFGRLFQRFARLDAARAQHIPGSGLGLAISRTLTELQGGTISVESVVGRGTTFTILLPRHALLAPSTALPHQP